MEKPKSITSGISIVIPAFNEEKFLPETLSFVQSGCRTFTAESGEPIEIIVVDNASTDNTSKVAEALGARVIRHDVRNIASVRNAGIKAANHQVVITVDADTFVPSDAFIKIWRAMKTGNYIGGGVRLGMRTQKLHLRIFISVMERLMVLVSGLSGGMFFFMRDDALEIGGFPETHLVAEDMTFARNLRSYGKARGKTFHNLRSVTILTFDRKDASFGKVLASLYKGLKAFLGIKVSKDELDYWYNPKR